PRGNGQNSPPLSGRRPAPARRARLVHWACSGAVWPGPRAGVLPQGRGTTPEPVPRLRSRSGAILTRMSSGIHPAPVSVPISEGRNLVTEQLDATAARSGSVGGSLTAMRLAELQ